MSEFTVDQALKEGVKAYQSGQLKKADSIYTAILAVRRDHPEANYNMGMLAVDLGEVQAALPFLKTATEANSGDSRFWLGYINSLIKLDRLSDAANALIKAKSNCTKSGDLDELERSLRRSHESIQNILNTHSLEKAFRSARKKTSEGSLEDAKRLYQDILKRFPKNKKAIYELNKLVKKAKYSLSKRQDPTQNQIQKLTDLYSQKQFQKALFDANTLLREFPKSAILHNFSGAAYKKLGQLSNSAEAYKKALIIRPSYADAYFNLGNVLKEQGKLDEALKSYQQSFDINPDHADLLTNMGIALQAKGRPVEAIEAYTKALVIQPDYAEAYNSMGLALQNQNKLDEAIAAFGRGLEIKPTSAKFYNNMGLALADQGNFEAAIDAYGKAIEIEPDYFDVYFNLGLVLLASKDFDAGFEYYDWRWQTDKFAADYLVTTKPRWDGEDKQRVLVWNEQGIGDEVMFSSIIPDLCKVSSKVIIRCDRRLIPLFKRSFPSDISYCSKDQVISEDDYDYHVPMGSLPLGLRKTLGSFAAMSPGFLKPDLDRASTFKSALLHGRNKKVVGLSWKTNSRLPKASTRNIKLADLALALHTDDTLLVCLQYGQVSDEIQAVKRELGIEIVQLDEVDNRTDLDGLASLMAACDEVVTVDNATTHLSGALGISTKLLLPTSPDWRWGTADDVSYWYDAVQLYRQSEPGNWQKVLAQI